MAAGLRYRDLKMDRYLRTAADLMRLALVLGSLWYLAFSEWQKHIGYVLGLLAIASLVLRLAKAPAAFDFAFMTLLSIDAWATAAGWLDQVGLSNDRPGHLLLSASVTPILFYAAARVKALNPSPENLAQTIGVGAMAMSMTIALGVVWELVEWQSDLRFGTDMSLGYSDTLGDLTCDVLGGLLGATVLVAVLTWQRAKSRESALAAAPSLATPEDADSQSVVALKAFPE